MLSENSSYHVKENLNPVLEIILIGPQKEGIVKPYTPKSIEKPSDEEIAKAFASYPEWDERNKAIEEALKGTIIRRFIESRGKRVGLSFLGFMNHAATRPESSVKSWQNRNPDDPSYTDTNDMIQAMEYELARETRGAASQNWTLMRQVLKNPEWARQVFQKFQSIKENVKNLEPQFSTELGSSIIV